MRCTLVLYYYISLCFISTHYSVILTEKMCLSKIAKQTDIDLKVNFDFDLNWDDCDYLNEETYTETLTDKDLNIMHWSVRGLTSKIDELKLLLGQNKQHIDVISLNKTWLSHTFNMTPNLAGYSLVSKPRKNRKGGGVGFLLRSNLPYRRRLDLESDSMSTEHIVVELKCKSKLLLCNMYRPPNSDVTQFLNKYTELLTRLKKEKHCNVVVCMDHNLDFLKQNKHAPTRKFL